MIVICHTQPCIYADDTDYMSLDDILLAAEPIFIEFDFFSVNVEKTKRTIMEHQA